MITAPEENSAILKDGFGTVVRKVAADPLLNIVDLSGLHEHIFK